MLTTVTRLSPRPRPHGTLLLLVEETLELRLGEGPPSLGCPRSSEGMAVKPQWFTCLICSQVMGELCFQGYLDAFRFLEENGRSWLGVTAESFSSVIQPHGLRRASLYLLLRPVE